MDLSTEVKIRDDIYYRTTSKVINKTKIGIIIYLVVLIKFNEAMNIQYS